jgi:Ca2+-binding RTX toxin-like protein
MVTNINGPTINFLTDKAIDTSHPADGIGDVLANSVEFLWNQSVGWFSYTETDAGVYAVPGTPADYGVATVPVTNLTLTNGNDVVEDGTGFSPAAGAFHNAVLRMAGDDDLFLINSDHNPSGTVYGGEGTDSIIVSDVNNYNHVDLSKVTTAGVEELIIDDHSHHNMIIVASPAKLDAFDKIETTVQSEATAHSIISLTGTAGHNQTLDLRTNTAHNGIYLAGSAANDTIWGFPSHFNKIIGLDGHDEIHGGSVGDILVGGNGADDLFGGGGDDDLNGQDGPDVLNGGAGPDTLYGADGVDHLVGGPSRDILRGGDDEDFFAFESKSDTLPGANRDVIEDFSHADHDKIDLSDLDANTRKGGNQPFHYIAGLKFDHQPGELRFSHHILQGDLNGDAKADFEIHINANSLSKVDFFL